MSAPGIDFIFGKPIQETSRVFVRVLKGCGWKDTVVFGVNMGLDFFPLDLVVVSEGCVEASVVVVEFSASASTTSAAAA